MDRTLVRSRFRAADLRGRSDLPAQLTDGVAGGSITLATTEEPVGTWLGSTAGMVVADGIAIALGALLGARLPERLIKAFAVVAFVVFGLILVVEGLRLA